MAREVLITSYVARHSAPPACEQLPELPLFILGAFRMLRGDEGVCALPSCHGAAVRIVAAVTSGRLVCQLVCARHLEAAQEAMQRGPTWQPPVDLAAVEALRAEGYNIEETAERLRVSAARIRHALQQAR